MHVDYEEGQQHSTYSTLANNSLNRILASIQYVILKNDGISHHFSPLIEGFLFVAMSNYCKCESHNVNVYTC